MAEPLPLPSFPGLMTRTTIPVTDAPDAVKAYTEERAVVDEDGRVVSTRLELITPSYCWRIDFGSTRYYVPQSINVWSYASEEESEDAEYATVVKIGLNERNGEIVYGGESRATAYLSRAAVDALVMAGKTIAPKKVIKRL